MKRKALAVVSASLSLILAAVLVTSAMASRDPFVGRWHSIDANPDHSNQTLSIGGSDPNYRVALYDDVESGNPECEDGPALATGTFSRDDDTLSGSFMLRCVANPSSLLGPFEGDFTYYPGDPADPADDTLIDTFSGSTWYRVQTPIP